VKADHLRAQAALVRMIYDPVFASVVRAQPDNVLSDLPAELRARLAAIDPRALRRDGKRRERTLAHLVDELPCTAALVRRESGPDRLLSFFGSGELHQAIEHDLPLVLALAAYVERMLAEGQLRSPHVACVLALELACARARRQRDRGDAVAGRVRRAGGVEPIEVPAGALETLQALRGAGELPALGPGRETLCAIELDGEVSIVELERTLWAVLISLPQPRTREAVLSEAALRLDGDRQTVTAALDSLLADELVLTS
jgi:hypothetical protein